MVTRLCEVEGHPAPTGRALTNDLCSQNVKVKINVKTGAAFLRTLRRVSSLRDANRRYITSHAWRRAKTFWPH